MSFIGNVPAEAYSPVAKDTFSGDDSTTDFTLSIPTTTNSVEVLVENVQQEPTTAYTISGTTLSFTAAPTTGTNNIYVVHRGPAVQTIVPPAGVAIDASTVDSTGDISTEGDLKVETTSGGIYTITGTDTATNRTLTLPDEAGTVLTSASGEVTGSCFSYFKSASDGDQTISNSTWTKVTVPTSQFDLNSEVSSSGFTPLVNGYYRFSACAVVTDSGASAVDRVVFGFRKNGNNVNNVFQFQFNSGNAAKIQANATLSMYVTTSDTIEFYLFATCSNSPVIDGSDTPNTLFQGELIRKA